MSDGELFLAFTLGAVGLACGLVIWISHELKKPPKSNVRVPKRTSWERAAKYYEDRT